jgi:hypothetical protein
LRETTIVEAIDPQTLHHSAATSLQPVADKVDAMPPTALGSLAS